MQESFVTYELFLKFLLINKCIIVVLLLCLKKISNKPNKRMINILKNLISTNQVIVGTPGSNHSNINWFYYFLIMTQPKKNSLKLIIKKRRATSFHGSYVCYTCWRGKDCREQKSMLCSFQIVFFFCGKNYYALYPLPSTFGSPNLLAQINTIHRLV